MLLFNNLWNKILDSQLFEVFVLTDIMAFFIACVGIYMGINNLHIPPQEQMQKTTGILDSYGEGLRYYNHDYYIWIKLEDGTTHYVFGHLYNVHHLVNYLENAKKGERIELYEYSEAHTLFDPRVFVIKGEKNEYLSYEYAEQIYNCARKNQIIGLSIMLTVSIIVFLALILYSSGLGNLKSNKQERDICQK